MIEIIKMLPMHRSYVSAIIKNRWEIYDDEYKPWIEEYLQNTNNSTCFIATENNIPIGMGIFQINNDVGVDLHPWLLGLWVNPEHRGKGIGQKLTLERFKLAKSLKYTNVYLDTTQAEEYHLKFGWKRNGRIGIYHGESTIIMEHKI